MAILNYLKNMFSSKVSENARVISKRQQEYVVTTPYGGSNHKIHCVTFELHDGSCKEFSVKPKIYQLLAENERGILESQGNWFCKFTPNMK